jgi:hypothetical protein
MSGVRRTDAGLAAAAGVCNSSHRRRTLARLIAARPITNGEWDLPRTTLNASVDHYRHNPPPLQYRTLKNYRSKDFLAARFPDKIVQARAGRGRGRREEAGRAEAAGGCAVSLPPSRMPPDMHRLKAAGRRHPAPTAHALAPMQALVLSSLYYGIGESPEAAPPFSFLVSHLHQAASGRRTASLSPAPSSA